MPISLSIFLYSWTDKIQTAVPLYSVWLAYSTFTGAKNGLMGGGMPADSAQQGTAGGQSKRQAKLEKRGGQRVQYR